MLQTEIQREALHRATSSLSLSNYPAIYAGFAEKGITDVSPRENVFTYHAWRALNRQVKRGEHGVKLTTWITRERKATAERPAENVKLCRTVTVFHVSQTEPIEDYSVIVGNIGEVYSGADAREAKAKFDTYVESSKSGIGRAGGEDVTLLRGGEIVREFIGANHDSD